MYFDEEKYFAGVVPKEGYHEKVLNKDGLRLTGTFKDGKLNGVGIVNYYDNGTYLGEFVDGLRHGKGSYAGKRATLFGSHENGLFGGTSEVKYDGFWKNDCLHGYGKLEKMIRPDPYWREEDLIYEGHFKKNLFHGPGILSLGNQYADSVF